MIVEVNATPKNGEALELLTQAMSCLLQHQPHLAENVR